MQENSKKTTWLIVLSIVLSLIIVVLLGYIASQKGYIKLPFGSKTATTDTNSDTTTSDQTTPLLQNTETFTGKIITASLPQGWSMKEYFDGEGTSYLVEGVKYTGLTGIKIFNAENQEIFYLEAVSGIGMSGCPEYYAFKDDSPTYRDQMQGIVDEMGSSMHINDLSSASYSEFKLLGTTLRRINKKLYIDETKGNNFFEASCFGPLVAFDGLSFAEKSTKKQSYFYGYGNSVTNDELRQIDSILATVTLVK